MDAGLRDCGDCFAVRVFGTEIVMHASPELVRELLAQPADVLAAGRANDILGPMVGSSSLLLLDGDEHLAMRRLQLPSFHGERMRAYERTMQSLADAGVARWPLEEPVAAWPRMQSITLDIIVRVVFGIEEDRSSQAVRAAVKDLLRVGTRRGIFAAAGIKAAVTGRRPQPDDLMLRPVARARERLAELLDAEIRRRRASGEDRGDVLSTLVLATDDDGAPLPTAVVRDQLVTLLVAGHETTATALSWAVERIARHPELQDRLAVEALDGRHELIDATVKEVLRARPVLPLFMREVVQPVEIGGTATSRARCWLERRWRCTAATTSTPIPRPSSPSASSPRTPRAPTPGRRSAAVCVAASARASRSSRCASCSPPCSPSAGSSPWRSAASRSGGARSCSRPPAAASCAHLVGVRRGPSRSTPSVRASADAAAAGGRGAARGGPPWRARRLRR